MSEEIRGALLLVSTAEEPHITGYLVIGNKHFGLFGWREDDKQGDLDGAREGRRQRDRD